MGWLSPHDRMGGSELTPLPIETWAGSAERGLCLDGINAIPPWRATRSHCQAVAHSVKCAHQTLHPARRKGCTVLCLPDWKAL